MLQFFIGAEVEGPDRMRQTIFLAKGYVTEKNFDEVHTKIMNAKCNRVYFGASNTRGMSKQDIRLAKVLSDSRTLGGRFELLCEFTDLEELGLLTHEVPSLQGIYVLDWENDLLPLVKHFKVVGQSVMSWGKIERNILSVLEDPLYKLDKEL